MSEKKEQFYPIECHVKSQGAEFNGQIVALTASGLLFNAGTHVLKSSEHLQIKFELPVVKKIVEGTAMVFKTYDTFKGHHGLANPGDHLVEFIFKTVPMECKNSISLFLAHVQAHNV